VQSGWLNLRVVLSGATDAAAVSETFLLLQYNGDTGSNYDYQQHGASNTTASASDGNAQTSLQIGRFPGATSGAGTASGISINIYDYSGPFFTTSFSMNNHSLGIGAANRRVTVFHGSWRSTAPITQIRIFPTSGNFIPGTIISMYAEF
jgi:hypothetical protein